MQNNERPKCSQKSASHVSHSPNILFLLHEKKVEICLEKCPFLEAFPTKFRGNPFSRMDGVYTIIHTVYIYPENS